MHKNAIRPYIQSVVSDIEPSDVNDEDYVSFQLITKIRKPKVTFHKNLLYDTEDEQLPVTSCLVLNVVATPPGEANRAVNKSQRTHRGRGCEWGRGRGVVRVNQNQHHVCFAQQEQHTHQQQQHIMTAKNVKVRNVIPPAIHKRGPQDIIRHHWRQS